MKTILHIIKKEILQFKRDPKMFGIVLVAPVMQLVLLGFAATLDVNVINTTILDQDKSEVSRNFIKEVQASGYFKIVDYLESHNAVTEKLDGGKILTTIIIPKDFEKKIERKETSKMQLIFNASDGNAATIAAGYMINIIANFNTHIVVDYLEVSGRKIKPIGSITPEVRIWYNPLLISRYYMVPGIVGLVLSLLTIILTSLAIVKEKEIGTMEQLIVTPIKPHQLILGKLIPFVMLSFIAVTVILIAMRFVTQIEVRGSIPFLFLASFIYIISTLGTGLFVSTISKNQQQAMMFSFFGAMMPLVYLSGFTFPIENMPIFFQYISAAIPLSYFNNILRGVILKGTGFAEHWLDLTVMLALGVFIITMAAMRFKKRLE